MERACTELNRQELTYAVLEAHPRAARALFYSKSSEKDVRGKRTREHSQGLLHSRRRVWEIG